LTGLGVYGGTSKGFDAKGAKVAKFATYVEQRKKQIPRGNDRKKGNRKDNYRGPSLRSG